MNAPFLWILLPASGAILLYFLQEWEKTVAALATLLSLSLAALALWLPIEEQIGIGPWVVPFTDTLNVLGRRFILSAADRPALVMLYITAALWFGAAPVARSGRVFVPLGLAMVALLTAAIAVDPFLYAALIIAIAVLVSIPFLSPAGKWIGSGVLRYLTYLTLGMPFILFTGSLLAGVESTPGDQTLILVASILLAVGFSLLLAVFPFHTWIPMLAQEAHPYLAAFVFLMLPGAVFFFGLSFFDRFPWLRDYPNVNLALQWIGVLMIVFAGVWSGFQRHPGRLLGFAVILEIGFGFVAIGLASGEQSLLYLGEFFAGWLPRGIGLGVWALALSALQSASPKMGFEHIRGLARRYPLAGASLILAIFSLAGIPLLASFPIRMSLLSGLAESSAQRAVLALLGMAGLLLGGLRTLAVLIAGEGEARWQLSEGPILRIYLGLGILAMLLLGLFPQWFLPFFQSMPAAFERLVP
jgi:NADH:ubiquinone oxidoreductase subunit 2 (subunit N)